MKRAAFALAILCLCQPGSADSRRLDDYAKLNAVLTLRVVLPGYTRFAADAGALAGSIAALCAQPSAAALEKSRQRFHAAMDAWQRVQSILLGPALNGFGPARVQFWPDKRGTGARQLARALAEEDRALLDPAALADRSVALSDLQALERVLFESELLAPGAYACALAQAIAERQRRLAEEILAQWQGEQGYARIVLSVREGNGSFFDAAEVTSAYFRSMVDALDRVVAFKLERPLGESAGAARPTRGENWRSRRSLRNIRINLEAARALFVTPGGFADLLVQTGAETMARDLAVRFERVLATAQSVRPPLYAAVSAPAPHARLLALRGEVAELRQSLSDASGSLLGLAAGFNATDGDG